MLPGFASSKCFALRAELNGKYLQSAYARREGGSRIEASSDTCAGNARTRFLVERSEEEEGLVHVRCCYNNRYWVPVQVQGSGSSRRTIGTADEPEEDLSSPSCTLFQAIPIRDKDNSIRLFHCGARSACFVSIIGNKTYLRNIDGAEDQETNSSIFTLVALPRQKELPKHVAFKGDDGKYLGTNHVTGPRMRKFGKAVQASSLKVGPLMMGPLYLGLTAGAEHAFRAMEILGQKFETEDIGDKSVIFTTYTNDDGSVRIASYMGGFWKRTPTDYIVTCNVEDENDRDALFEVVTGDGFVALRNLGNNKFCKRADANAKTNYLRACEDTMSKYTRFKLVEPVCSEEIYDVQFYLTEARIYNSGVITMGDDVRTNGTGEVQTGTFSFTKRTEAVGTWETTISSKTIVGEKYSANFSQTPMVLGKEVTLSGESGSSQRDAEATHNSEERTVTQNLTIYPGETIKGEFVASRASCDVPFSYKKKIVLTTGQEIYTEHEDGIYTGVNRYDFHVTLTRTKASKVYNIINSNLCLFLFFLFLFHLCCKNIFSW